MQERNKRREIDRRVDKQADRMIEEEELLKNKVKWVDGALFNTLNSIITWIIIDYYINS